MKELDPLVLLAVFQEMLGLWLWVLLALIAVATVAFVLLLVKERGIQSRRLVRMQALGLAGGILALVLMVQVSSSGFTDAGGPLDWLLIALVFALGWVGAVIGLYTLIGWMRCCKRKAA